MNAWIKALVVSAFLAGMGSSAWAQACAQVQMIKSQGTAECGPTTDCTIDLTVETDSSTGRCCVVVPIAKILIHTAMHTKKPTVNFVLRTEGFHFRGKNGIRLDDDVNQSQQYLNGPGHVSNDKTTFKWKSTGKSTEGSTDAPDGLPFVPMVYVKGHQEDLKQRCLARDPVIVNTDN